MKSRLLNISGVQELSKESQKSIVGQAGKHDLSLCGCDCAGSVTGPALVAACTGRPAADGC